MQLSDSSSLAQKLLPQRLDIFLFESPLTPVKPALAFAYTQKLPQGDDNVSTL